ncbi:MAG: polyketide synthase dehydratase domain-containing protein, partial [Actinobacteria bacterium]|nr:polyketide synthase dehydratase domain-containing protein [Actinomycetota bacterium]
MHTLDRGALASRAAEIAAAQPDCQHVHLDQPAWTARGLGERPKLVNQLAAADTPPIGLAAASRLLLRAFSTPGRPASIAVHGRVGGLARRPAPTISSEELAAAGMPKGGRFLRQVAVHYPGIELICAARISLASDPYLADYRIDGLPALPPVVALEALAQAASVLAGRPVRQAMSVRFDTPAVIPEGGAAMLRVCAQRDGDTVIAVLRCSQSSYRVDHAAATFSCEQAGMADSPVAVGSSAVPPLVSAAATGLVDGAELYGPVCFQAGPFRRIALLPEITPRSGRAIARGADEQPWFATGGTLDSASFLLGSPGLNDAVLQVLQACVPHRRIRLVSCESVQFAGRDVTGPVEIRAIAGPIRPADRADRADRADYADRPDRPGYADRPDHGNGAIGANGANGATSVSLSDGFNKVPLSELLNPAPPGAHRRPRQPGKLRTWRSTPPGQAGNGELDRRSRTAMGEATRSDLQVTRADAIRADSGPAGRQLWSVEAVNGAGQLLASWRGIRLADAGPLPRNSPWPPTLLAVFLERCAADLGLDAGLRVTISCGQPDVPTAAIPRQSVSTGDGLPDFRDRTASGRHAGPERRGINTVTARGTGQLAGFTLTARAPTPV